MEHRDRTKRVLHVFEQLRGAIIPRSQPAPGAQAEAESKRQRSPEPIPPSPPQSRSYEAHAPKELSHRKRPQKLKELHQKPPLRPPSRNVFIDDSWDDGPIKREARVTVQRPRVNPLHTAIQVGPDIENLGEVQIIQSLDQPPLSKVLAEVVAGLGDQSNPISEKSKHESIVIDDRDSGNDWGEVEDKWDPPIIDEPSPKLPSWLADVDTSKLTPRARNETKLFSSSSTIAHRHSRKRPRKGELVSKLEFVLRRLKASSAIRKLHAPALPASSDESIIPSTLSTQMIFVVKSVFFDSKFETCTTRVECDASPSTVFLLVFHKTVSPHARLITPGSTVRVVEAIGDERSLESISSCKVLLVHEFEVLTVGSPTARPEEAELEELSSPNWRQIAQLWKKVVPTLDSSGADAAIIDLSAGDLLSVADAQSSGTFEMLTGRVCRTYAEHPTIWRCSFLVQKQNERHVFAVWYSGDFHCSAGDKVTIEVARPLRNSGIYNDACCSTSSESIVRLLVDSDQILQPMQFLEIDEATSVTVDRLLSADEPIISSQNSLQISPLAPLLNKCSASIETGDYRFWRCTLLCRVLHVRPMTGATWSSDFVSALYVTDASLIDPTCGETALTNSLRIDVDAAAMHAHFLLRVLGCKRGCTILLRDVEIQLRGGKSVRLVLDAWSECIDPFSTAASFIDRSLLQCVQLSIAPDKPIDHKVPYWLQPHVIFKAYGTIVDVDETYLVRKLKYRLCGIECSRAPSSSPPQCPFCSNNECVPISSCRFRILIDNGEARRLVELEQGISPISPQLFANTRTQKQEVLQRIKQCAVGRSMWLRCLAPRARDGGNEGIEVWTALPEVDQRDQLSNTAHLFEALHWMAH